MLEQFDITPTLPAADLERAKRWNQEKLGLTPERESQEELSYRSGSGSFGVYRSSFAGTAQNTAAGWQVDNLEKVMEDLRGRGVTFEEYDFPGLKTENGIASFPEGGGRGCWFKDSEGNILALVETTST